jgi:hypothetical protein
MTQWREPWQQLCEQAEKEHDPERLLELMIEINRQLGIEHNSLDVAGLDRADVECDS